MISRRLDRLQSPHFVFFFNDTATTEIYTLSLHDALPISTVHGPRRRASRRCSSTDSDGHTRRPWGTYPTPLAVITFGADPKISSPASLTLPEARTSPVTALHSVVLPMPLRPTTARTPWASPSDTPCSAWARP